MIFRDHAGLAACSTAVLQCCDAADVGEDACVRVWSVGGPHQTLTTTTTLSCVLTVNWLTSPTIASWMSRVVSSLSHKICHQMI